MKKIFPFCLLLLGVITGYAQTRTNYWIRFTDKNNSPYSIERPEAFLSPKAIARREKQQIPVTASDLPVNPAYLKGLKDLGLTVLHTSRWMNAVSVTNADAAAIKAVSTLPYVSSVKEISIPASTELPSKFIMEKDMSFPQLSGQRNSFNYGPSFYQADQIGMVCMHDLGYRGEGMTIAVLDAGFFKVDSLQAFDSLLLENRLLGCRDFVTGDTLVFEDANHGMNVLSCMAGNLPGKIIGTAPKASYWLLRTEDAGTETMQEEINWLVGSEFADSVGADIINSSLGYSIFDDSSENHTFSDLDGNTTIVTQAADIAASKGIFVCSSAGNSGGPPWYKITAPADADSILTVGAVDSAGVIAGFSSRGPTSDGRIKPNTVARGAQAIVAVYPSDIVAANGTSFSSPITAGAVACLWQAHPSKNNIELLLAIQQSASQAAAPDSIMGYGIPDFCAANTLLTGIQEAGYQDMINVFPNPFSNELHISWSSSVRETLLLELTDISGRCVHTAGRTVNAGTTEIVLYGQEDLAPGMYLLRVGTSTNTSYRKLIKN